MLDRALRRHRRDAFPPLHLVLAALCACATLAGCRRQNAARGDAAPATANDEPQQDRTAERVSLGAGGESRDYLLHVPAAARGHGPVPLVISLHGGGGKAEGVARQTGWLAVAEREGFVVAFPNGIGRSWNDGRGDTPSRAVRSGIDDVAFLAALIEDVTKRTPIDRKRVFMNGMSNGSFMTARFACEHAEMLAAIGLVAGTIGPELLGTCKPSRHVSVIAFHGIADPIVPFQGGVVAVGSQERGRAASFAESVQLWAYADACEPPQRSTVPDLDPADDSTVTLDTYRCAGGAAVAAYAIAGGGHTWPGGRPYLPKRVVGPVNRDIDATRAMWTFFVAHPSE